MTDKNAIMKSLFACLVVSLLSFAVLAEEVTIGLPSGESIAYARYPAKGKDLLLWFAAERGVAPTEIQAARELADKGVDVWQFDLTSALFLPQTHSSMDGIKVQDMQAILDLAKQTGAKLTIYAVNRAAVPVLRALAGGRYGKTRVMLMHPHFYSSVDVMVGADYVSFGDLSGVDALILQPRRSAATPWVENQLAALRNEKARVKVLILENVREAFWVRETATDFEVAEGKKLAERMISWRKLFR